MINYNNLNAQNPHVLNSKNKRLAISKKLSPAFSDNEILDFQNDLLTTGFHYIAVESLKEGRHLITLFLNSLNYYQDIACLTMNNQNLPENVRDLYELLLDYGYAQETMIERFIDEHWFFDFLWIEASAQITALSWFSRFLQLITSYNIAQKMPVLMVTCYDD